MDGEWCAERGVGVVAGNNPIQDLRAAAKARRARRAVFDQEVMNIGLIVWFIETYCCFVEREP